MRTPTIAIATNNGDIGGGEVMLLNIAGALRRLGLDVLVLGPSSPAELIERAHEQGFRTVALRAKDRGGYIAALWRWRLRNRGLPLWCNGLVPSLATTGIGPRIVHLHRLPVGAHAALERLARSRSSVVLVPSGFVADRLHGTTIFENWTEQIRYRGATSDRRGPVRIGILGRLTAEKGAVLLAEAASSLMQRTGRDVRLVLAGENRFGNDSDRSALESSLAPIRDRVEQLGWVDREDFFEAVDLAVFPSVVEESFGLVAAEAMAAGIPFVISESGALPEVAGVDHPWIARRGDSDDLAHVIEQALADIERGDHERSAAARARWERRYSPAAGMERVAGLLSDLGATSRERGSP